MNNRRRTQKAILILSGLLLVCFVIGIRISSTGYSDSLYRQVPVAVRILFIFIYILSICGVIYSLYHKNHRTAIFWTIPVISQYGLFFALPTLLGYQLTGPDFIAHITVMQEGLLTARLEDEYRPSMYVLGMFLATIGEINTSDSLYIVSIGSNVTFFLILVALARRIRIAIAPVLIAGLVPVSFYPTPASITYSVFFTMALFLLSVWLIDRDWRWILLFCYFVITMPLFHPLPAVFFTGLLTIALFLPSIHYVRENFSVYLADVKPALGIGLITIVSTWFLLNYLQNIVGRVVTIVTAAILGRKRPETRATEDVLDTVFGQLGYSVLDFIWLGIRTYGEIGLLIGLAIFGLLGLVFSRPQSRVTTLFAAVILIPPIAGLADFVVGIASGVGFVRLFRPSLYLAPIFAGAAVVVGLEFRDSHRVAAVSLLLITGTLLTGTVLLSTANHYDDPEWTLSVNENRLDSDVDGYSWYIEHKDREKDTISLWRRFHRIAWDLVPVTERNERIDEFKRDRGEHRPPANFGGEQKFGATIESESYYIESRSERAFVFEAFPEISGINANDYEKLDSDRSVDRIYQNGNIDIRVVRTELR